MVDEGTCLEHGLGIWKGDEFWPCQGEQRCIILQNLLCVLWREGRSWPTWTGAFTLDKRRIMPGDHAPTGIWEGIQENIGLNTMAGKGGRDPVAEGAKARVFGNQQEPTA
jgi:hypothetical protein